MLEKDVRQIYDMCYVYSDCLHTFRYLITSIQFMLRLCSFMQQPQGLHAQTMKSIPSFRGLQKIMWIILVEVSQP